MPTTRATRGRTTRLIGLTTTALIAAMLAFLPGLTSPARAQFATSGTGAYKGMVDWVVWGTGADTPIANGQVTHNSRTLAGKSLDTACTVGNIGTDPGQVAPQTYDPTTWGAAAFPQQYAMSATTYDALKVGGGQSTRFDLSCSVTYDGTAVPVSGLVMADAEQNASDEWIQGVAPAGATWRIIDRDSSCGFSARATRTGQTLKIAGDPSGYCGQPGTGTSGVGPSAVAFLAGGTSATFSMQGGAGGGLTAIAIGVVLPTNYGDAPASYGDAGAIYSPDFNGGTLSDGAAMAVNDASFTLGTPGDPATMLGSTIDSQDASRHGANAAGDDADDALTDVPAASVAAGDAYAVPNIACTGAGYVNGWIDWNENGTFDSGEAATADRQCSGGKVSLSWTVPSDVASGSTNPAGHSFLRLRIANAKADVADPTGITTSGEVEDYPVEVTKLAATPMCRPGMNSQWRFGQNAGIDFSSGVPVAKASSVNTGEGVATISDAAGSLLFYTDGSTVWGPDDQPLQNGTGLLGNSSSTESALIVPRPGTTSQYYLFSADNEYNHNGRVAYSIVDTTQGTEGAVLAGSKNTVLQGAGGVVTALPSEKLAGTVTGDGSQAWVVTTDKAGTNAYVWSVTHAGVTLTHTVNAGAPGFTFSGYLTFSPGGSKLAAANVNNSNVLLMDFDNATGAISDPQVVSGTGQAYGVAFSPNSKVMYVSAPGAVRQYDVSGATPTLSATFTPSASGTWNAVALGPDGQLYVADSSGNSGPANGLDVIASPNTLGTGAHYIKNPGIFPASSASTSGLPNMVACPVSSTYVDWGDAPASYGTSFVDNGARAGLPGYDPAHETADLMLGDKVSADGDGQPDPAAAADGDDDGLVSYNPSNGNATVKVTNDSGGVATVAAWLDADGSGTFDAAERSEVETVPAGTTENVTLTLPGHLPVGGSAFLRLRVFGGNVADPQPIGATAAGEVEDLQVDDNDSPTITPSTCSPLSGTYYALTFSDPVDKTGDGSVGSSARYADVTTIGGHQIDMVATVTAGNLTTNDANATTQVNGFGVGTGAVIAADDADWQVQTGAVIEYDFYLAGTTTPVQVSAVFNVNDVDNGEKATFTSSDIAGYALSAASALNVTTSGGQTVFAGTTGSTGTGIPASRFQFAVEDTTSFSVKWNGGTNSGFGFDGNGGLSVEPACRTLALAKSASLTSGTGGPGSVVTYTVTATNDGTKPFDAAHLAQLSDNLADVVDDATYDDAAVSFSGSSTSAPPAYDAAAKKLSWSGPLDVGETVTMTYSVTVGSGAGGNSSLVNNVCAPATQVAPGESTCATTTTAVTPTPPATPAPTSCMSPSIQTFGSGTGFGAALPAGTTTYPYSGSGTLVDGHYQLVSVTSGLGGWAIVNGHDHTGDPDGYMMAVGANATPDTFYTQTFTGMVPGTAYDFSAWIANLDKTHQPVPPNVLFEAIDPVTGDVLAQVQSGDVPFSSSMIWRRYGLTFVATQSTIQVKAINAGPGGNGNDLALDDVSLGLACDFGDAPDTYGTTIAANGASALVGGPYLGATAPDSDGDGHPSVKADGDDTTGTVDEDGLVSMDAMGGAAVVKAANPTGQDATLVGWLDANGNGQFDSDERSAIVTVPADAALDSYTLTFANPMPTPAASYVRFRIYAGAVADPQPTGAGGPGEVEDFVSTTPHLEVSKSASSYVAPAAGDTLTYTVTATNDGSADYTSAHPAHVVDDLSGVLDDATFGTATASVGGSSVTAPSLSGSRLVWSQPLAMGATVTITYTVTYTGAGDHRLHNVVFAPPTEVTDPTPDCTATTVPCDTVDVPGSHLTVTKSVDPAAGTAVTAGDVLTYTLSFANDGSTDATVEETDTLTGVLDDADVTTAPTASDPNLTIGAISAGRLPITGTVPVGATYTVTYAVTVKDGEDQGDHSLDNFVGPTGTPPPATCYPSDPGCVSNPVSNLVVTKSATVTGGGSVQVGSVVTYTLTFANDGTASAPVAYTDTAGDVIDDAGITTAPVSSNPNLTVGAVAPLLGTFPVTGSVPGGSTYTVTYVATVKAWADQGNHVLNNYLEKTGTPPPATCAAGSETCTSNGIAHVSVTKSVSPASGTSVTAGDVLTYTVKMTSDGTAPALADFTDLLGSTLDDADLVAVPSAGGVIVTWTAATQRLRLRVPNLAPGSSTTVTYQVRVKDWADQGDHRLVNLIGDSAALPSTPPTSCAAGDPGCTDNPISDLSVTKSVSPGSGTPVDPGGVLSYTLTFANDGTGSAAVDSVDFLGNVLDDADLTTAPVASNPDLTVGAISSGALPITGTVPAGATYIVTYAVTVKPFDQQGDHLLGNVVGDAGSTPPAPGTPCSPTDPTCTSNGVPGLSVVKSGLLTQDANGNGKADVGDEITYSFTATNTGAVPLRAVTVDDPMVTGVTPASADLAPGAVAVFTAAPYVVTQDDLDGGQVDNTATATGEVTGGGKITSPPSKVTVTTAPGVPGLSVAKSGVLTTDRGVVGKGDAGDVITYTFVVTNTGNVTADDVTVADPLPGLSALSPAKVGSMKPGASATFTAAYTLTAADVVKTEIDNVATASGTRPATRGGSPAATVMSPPSNVVKIALIGPPATGQLKGHTNKKHVTLHVKASGAVKAAKIKDVLHLKGWRSGGHGVKATVTLYGPAANDHSCARSTKVTTVHVVVKNGVITTPGIKVKAAGYYNWTVSVPGNEVNKAQKLGCGARGQSTLVERPGYGTPVVSTGYDGVYRLDPRVDGARFSRGGAAIRIPGLGISAHVDAVGLADGQMRVPGDVARTGWLRSSAALTDKIGTTVIAGHVSDLADQPGAFYRLQRAKVGQVVSVSDTAGKTHRFKISSVASYPRAGSLPAGLFSTTGRHQLVLITCTDKVVHPDGLYHYEDNKVVIAKPIG